MTQKKVFQVSPFNPLQQQYRWRIGPPGKAVGVAISVSDGRGEIFEARLQLARQELDKTTVRRLLLKKPIMTAFVLLTSCALFQRGAAPELSPLQALAHADLTRLPWPAVRDRPLSEASGKAAWGSTAMYAARPNGEIDVLNSCWDEQDGSLSEAKGRASVVDNASNARLKVFFFWPFRGDYCIIDLGKEYGYAVVGTPSRKYLWILSRTPEMHPEVLTKIIENVEKQGFVRDKLLLPLNEVLI